MIVILAPKIRSIKCGRERGGGGGASLLMSNTENTR